MHGAPINKKYLDPPVLVKDRMLHSLDFSVCPLSKICLEGYINYLTSIVVTNRSTVEKERGLSSIL